MHACTYVLHRHLNWHDGGYIRMLLRRVHSIVALRGYMGTYMGTYVRTYRACPCIEGAGLYVCMYVRTSTLGVLVGARLFCRFVARWVSLLNGWSLAFPGL